MSEPRHSPAASGPPSQQECDQALERMYEFLDHELDTASSDTIRQHLAACEPCLDAFDVEQAIKALVHRRCGGDVAPSSLRAKVMLSITTAQSNLYRS